LLDALHHVSGRFLLWDSNNGNTVCPGRHSGFLASDNEFINLLAKTGHTVRGIPTSYAAEPLKSEIAASSDLPPVWPWHEGDTRGVGFKPLYKSVPHAALRDPALYQLLALVDAIRDGRARERNLAERDLVQRLRSSRGQS
jgi:hypothetical protein